MRHLRALLFLFLAVPACAQFIPHAPAKGGYCLNPSNVWIPINAFSQTGSALPNGAPAGDLYGLNSNGTWYGLACDANGKLIIPGAGSPGGTNTQLQWNNNGDFAGASGGTTNGTHFAFGAGSTVDSAPATAPLGYPTATNTIGVFSETYTGTEGENGLYISNTLNPSAQTAGNASYGIVALPVAESDNYNNEELGAGIFIQTYSGGTSAEDIEGIGAGTNYTGTTTVSQAQPTNAICINSNTGTIANCATNQSQTYNINPAGTIQNSTEYYANFFSNGGTTEENTGLVLQSPTLNGGALITFNQGLDIEPQCGTGIAGCEAINADGDDPSFIGGPTTFGDIVAPGILTLAQGTTNIATATGEGWQFNCSDCDTPLTEGATCTAAGDHAGTLAIALRGAIKCF